MSSTATSLDSGVPQDGPGSGLVRGPSIALLLVILVVLDLLTFYGIWTFWPAENASGGRIVHVFGLSRNVSRETEFFVIVALAGALGGSIHSIRSIAWYIGNRRLRWSWTPFYVLQPLVGATLATLFYFVLRAGLFSPSTQTKATSPYGFAALAALVGLFSEQAVEKLKTVAEEFFQEAPKGVDQAPQITPAPDQQADDGLSASPQAVTAGPGAPTLAGSAAFTGDATDISATGVTLTGVATSAGEPASCRFEYGIDLSYGAATADQPVPTDPSSARVTTTLSELMPATLYHYRFVVVDQSGSSTGEDRTLTTLA
jgi:hypothetical protein